MDLESWEKMAGLVPRQATPRCYMQKNTRGTRSGLGARQLTTYYKYDEMEHHVQRMLNLLHDFACMGGDHERWKLTLCNFINLGS